tara:strand:- start:1563 stop:1847 length:285 start_codon:yes stop_codon:yes gene_type:complete
MIKIIQLATGEQLITEYDDVSHKMTNPLFIHVVPNETGGQVSLHPYDMIIDGDIELNPDQIIWTGTPEQKILNQYQDVFKSIITPPDPKVTPIK